MALTGLAAAIIVSSTAGRCVSLVTVVLVMSARTVCSGEAEGLGVGSDEAELDERGGATLLRFLGDGFLAGASPSTTVAAV
ncbi:hypothetical protein QBC46DRAFT_380970 [Diplogelasinospora grovesii]|uniref:Secreted protein n=1 Tax=Diplogelasinospora grovesii TaxID=303347 RepID=A0AAN6S6N8_9PEZI|nr:hypothetical protein QBC46DRAFT_380970 [Diplogelasinospora grovesii]